MEYLCRLCYKFGNDGDWSCDKAVWSMQFAMKCLTVIRENVNIFR